MQQATEDRRRNLSKASSFQLLDSNGNEIMVERRSGNERRKDSHGYRVARNIINCLNLSRCL